MHLALPAAPGAPQTQRVRRVSCRADAGDPHQNTPNPVWPKTAPASPETAPASSPAPRASSPSQSPSSPIRPFVIPNKVRDLLFPNVEPSTFNLGPVFP